MSHILRLVKDILNNEKSTAEMKLQISKIVELEDKFTKDFSKNKRDEYFKLELEKGQLHNIEIDHVIETTYQVTKHLFTD